MTEIWLCRRIYIATREWTSSATSRDAQVRRYGRHLGFDLRSTFFRSRARCVLDLF
ncbi:hypothetical protein [Streptosporangium sp. NPDC000396]|uniref:hypothetical protein n=1 Tax=Streptosporangium sp. NPDC000396 TaxID=3366185 RepID=UPI0036C2D53F